MNRRNLGKLSKNIYCQQCRRLLCKRVPVTLEGDETYALHVKHRGYELRTFMAVVTCPNCRSCYRLSGDKGIEEKIPNQYFEAKCRN